MQINNILGCGWLWIFHILHSTEFKHCLGLGTALDHSSYALWWFLLEQPVRSRINLLNPPISNADWLISYHRSVPDWLVWLKYLSWFLYSNELLVINQWDGFEFEPCDNFTLPCYPDGETVYKSLGFSKVNHIRHIVKKIFS